MHCKREIETQICKSGNYVYEIILEIKCWLIRQKKLGYSNFGLFTQILTSQKHILTKHIDPETEQNDDRIWLSGSKELRKWPKQHKL